MGNIFEYINTKSKRIFSSVKKSWRKLKYLDRTQLNYYMVTGFIGLFCMFTGITYAAFTLNIDFGTIATIRIAKLSYTFSVDSYEDCESCTVGEASDNYIPITIPANTTGMIDFKLVSKNKNFTHNNIVATTRTFDTKYAIDYSSTTGTVTDFASTDNVSIYYSQNYKYNMEGEIGPDGSIIVPLRAVIENESASSKTIYFTVIGGYLQNDISSNITEGYYETTEPVIRYVLLDERLGYVQNLNEAPTNTENTGYSYFRTVCTESDAIPVMNYTTGVMTLDNSGRTTNVSCDVYFKKQCSTSNSNLCQDLEIYYSVTDIDGNETLSQTAPTNGGLAYTGYTCGSEATITETWDSTNEKWTTTISNVDGPTSCVINFKEKATKILSQAGASLALGDKIAIGDQNFWVISNTNGTVRALAEYNINVGDNKNPSVPEGLQHESVKGWLESGTRYGNVAFSNSSIAYSGSLVEGYINSYVNTLNSTYGTSVTGDAITKDEIKSLCNLTGSGTCANTNPWVYTTSYWSGSADLLNGVWYVRSNGSFSSTDFDYDYYNGVRPVIIISESSF